MKYTEHTPGLYLSVTAKDAIKRLRAAQRRVNSFKDSKSQVEIIAEIIDNNIDHIEAQIEFLNKVAAEAAQNQIQP